MLIPYGKDWPDTLAEDCCLIASNLQYSGECVIFVRNFRTFEGRFREYLAGFLYYLLGGLSILKHSVAKRFYWVLDSQVSSPQP